MNPEAADGEESSEEGRKESGDELKRDQPPDSKKFERDLARLQSAIRDKEANFKALPRFTAQTRVNTPKDKETLINELRELKARREKDIEARKQFDQELKTLNTQVSYKNDACSKLQAGLRFKTEARIDESVRRLEHQINAQQLTLKEEKRIVSEIDALKRSKKSLHEFLALKQVINQLRERLGYLRSQRNECVKRITASKSKEEQLNTALDEQRQVDDTKQAGQMNERESLKAEIDQLYRKKRELVATFHKEKSDYHAAMSEARAQAKIRRKELAAAKKAEEKPGHPQLVKSSRKEPRRPRDPHEKEKIVCANLITYMERLQSANVQATEASPEVEQLPVVGADSQGEGTFLKRKSVNDELVGLYAGLGKVTRKGSKKGRRSSSKETPRKLTLHPLVMDQLFSLHLTPPSTLADVPKLLEELHLKKELFDQIPPPEERPQSSGSATQMSPITEAVPSLPASTASSVIIRVSSDHDEVVSSDKISLDADRSDVTLGAAKLESSTSAEGGSQPGSALALPLCSSTEGGAELDEEISDASEVPSGISHVNEISETNAEGILDENGKGDAASNYSEGIFEEERPTKLSDGAEKVINLPQGGQLPEMTRDEKVVTLKENLKLSAERPLENGQESDGNLSSFQVSSNSIHSACDNDTESSVPDHEVNAKESSFCSYNSDSSLTVTSMKNELSDPQVNIPCAEKCLA